MTKTFYVIKWILRSFLFVLLLDFVVKSAVVAPNQKGNQDGTKLSEQRFLPETSPALYVEEEIHAPKLNQISRKRVKRGCSGKKALPYRFPVRDCKGTNTNMCDCLFLSSSKARSYPRWFSFILNDSFARLRANQQKLCQTNCEHCKNNWINQTCTVQLRNRCGKKTEPAIEKICTKYARWLGYSQ